MSIFNLHIRFTIRIGDLNQNGLAAIRCRLTYNKNRKDFSTGITVNPDHWDPKKQRLLDQSDQEETTNMQLSLIEHKISKAFLMLQVKEEPFTVQDIYDAYKGKTLEKEMGILEIWDLHNERMERLIGKEIVYVTYQKYLESQRHLKDFIRHQYKVSDKPLRGLKNKISGGLSASIPYKPVDKILPSVDRKPPFIDLFFVSLSSALILCNNLKINTNEITTVKQSKDERSNPKMDKLSTITLHDSYSWNRLCAARRISWRRARRRSEATKIANYKRN